MIYLDNAATTRIDADALQAMLQAMQEDYANPSASYRFAGAARLILQNSRREIAARLGVSPEEIFFTSGGTEGNNLAVIGVLQGNMDRNHVILSMVEHSSVLDTAAWLKTHGYQISWARPNSRGMVETSEIRRLLRPETALVSLQYANNETGTIQPVSEVSKMCKEYGALLHCDAVAAAGELPMHMDEIGADLLTTSSHKFGGPKGAGFLYRRKGIRITSLFYGGGQERGLRPGTENVPAIAGMRTAFCKRQDRMAEHQARVSSLRDLLQRRLLEEMPDIIVHGDGENRLGDILHISVPGAEGGKMTAYLDLEGICLSTGSACHANTAKPSHVLTAMRLSEEEISSALRLSLSEDLTEEEMEITVQKIKECRAKCLR